MVVSIFYFFNARMGNNTIPMSLINQILEAVKKGTSFSANHNGIQIYRPLDVIPVSCRKDHEGAIHYFTQEWAKKSIHHEDSVISFLITDDLIKMYY